MFRLEEFEARLGELDRQLMDPALAGKRELFREASREHAEVSRMVDVSREIAKLEAERADLKEMLAEPPAKPPEMETLEAQAKHCSEREREATEAERESIKLKQVEYAEQHVGDTFEGVVVSVTKFGVFVEIKKLLVQGLVHVRDMNDDYWEYDPNRYALVGRYSGRRIRTGNEVKVRITGANTQERQIDLAFAEEPGSVPDDGQNKGKRAQQRAQQISRRRKNKKRR